MMYFQNVISYLYMFITEFSYDFKIGHFSLSVRLLYGRFMFCLKWQILGFNI